MLDNYAVFNLSSYILRIRLASIQNTRQSEASDLSNCNSPIYDAMKPLEN